MWRVLREWDNGAQKHSEEEAEEFAAKWLAECEKEFEDSQRQRKENASRAYDKDRELDRWAYLRAGADAAFFSHMIASAVSPEQRLKQNAAETLAW